MFITTFFDFIYNEYLYYRLTIMYVIIHTKLTLDTLNSSYMYILSICSHYWISKLYIFWPFSLYIMDILRSKCLWCTVQVSAWKYRTFVCIVGVNILTKNWIWKNKITSIYISIYNTYTKLKLKQMVTSKYLNPKNLSYQIKFLYFVSALLDRIAD